MARNRKFNDHPFPYHHELELEITALTNLGAGLGRIRLEAGDRSLEAGAPDPARQNPGDGWVVLVPFALPGERVRARVFRNHKNYTEADLVEVLTPSPHRVTPRCPLFGRCGGCQYQNLAYPEQLAWKQRQMRELLRHMAGIDFDVAPVIPSPREYGYRSKITPHFSAQKRGKVTSSPNDHAIGTDEIVKRMDTPIGFLKQGSRFDIVDVPQCSIATPGINAKLAEVRAETLRKIQAGEYKRGATLLLRHAQEGVVTDYEAIIHEEIPLAAGTPAPSSAERPATGASRLQLKFLARDFFQNNPFVLPAFAAYVRSQAAACGACFLVDAYCGSGLFALAAASVFERVAGVDVSETSVAFARANAAANGIANASFLAGDAAAIFAGLDFPPADTVVVIDPPRKGCDDVFLRQLFAFGPRAVVYVSCDPATQMRDLRHFMARGYALAAVQPFDLFPQTRHLECVTTLELSRCGD